MNFHVGESSHEVKVSRFSSHVQGGLFDRLRLCKMTRLSSTAGLQIGHFFVEHS